VWGRGSAIPPTRQSAPLLDELGAVLDHVDAFSAGRPDAVENLVTSCNKCNGRKNASPAAEFEGLPRKFVKGKYGEPVGWDGLSALFVALARRHRGRLSTSEQQWLAVIEGLPLIG
jgi:hypothetical protein